MFSQRKSSTRFADRLMSSRFFPFNIPFYGILFFITIGFLGNLFAPPPMQGDVECKNSVIHTYEYREFSEDLVLKPSKNDNGTYNTCTPPDNVDVRRYD